MLEGVQNHRTGLTFQVDICCDNGADVPFETAEILG
jgi:hypothetical protein